MHDRAIPFYLQPCLENIYSEHGIITQEDCAIYVNVVKII